MVFCSITAVIGRRICGRVRCYGCSPVFSVGAAVTSTGSFKGCDLSVYDSSLGNVVDGLTFLNGAHPYDGRIMYSGNFAAGSSPAMSSTAAVRLSGQVPAGPEQGAYSSITQCDLVWGPECSPGRHAPRSVVFGGPSNVIEDCSGVLDFGGSFPPRRPLARARSLARSGVSRACCRCAVCGRA
jgi:hypothetical protein